MRTDPDRLHAVLNGLADEVLVVDLRDRALRTSRRIGIRRTAATIMASAAAVLVTAAGAGAAVALRPHGTVPPGAPASGRPDLPASAGQSASGRPDLRPVAFRSGRLYYVNTLGGVGQQRLWTPAAATTVALPGLPGLPGPGAAGSSTSVPVLSPDGRLRAQVAPGGSAGSSRLVVSDERGGGARVLIDHVAGGFFAPVWSPDSRRLLVALVRSAKAAPYQFGIIGVDSGHYQPIGGVVGAMAGAGSPPWGQDAQWSGDGRHLVFMTGASRGLQVFDTGGTAEWAMPPVNPNTYITGLNAVSADGSRAAVMLGNRTSAGTIRYASGYVIDTRTGRGFPLPPAIGHIRSMIFLPDDSLLVRTVGDVHNTLVLLSPAGTVIDEVGEPALLRDWAMISYVP